MILDDSNKFCVFQKLKVAQYLKYLAQFTDLRFLFFDCHSFSGSFSRVTSLTGIHVVTFLLLLVVKETL